VYAETGTVLRAVAADLVIVLFVTVLCKPMNSNQHTPMTEHSLLL
jgi:hypothetical protein